jgi:hypothetical protein
MIPNTILNIIEELWQESNPTVELILLGNHVYGAMFVMLVA